jgi:hypothetical protein
MGSQWLLSYIVSIVRWGFQEASANELTSRLRVLSNERVGKILSRPSCPADHQTAGLPESQIFWIDRGRVPHTTRPFGSGVSRLTAGDSRRL